MDKWGFSIMFHLKREGGYMVKILRSLYFDEKKVEGLNKLSAITRIPKAVLIREGIDLMLERHEKKLKRKRKKRGGS